MKIKIKKTHKDAVIPNYSKPGDAGLDLTAVDIILDNDNGVFIYDTGIAIEIPKGHVGLVFPRSSIYKTNLQLTNSVGVIDSEYRGTIKLVFKDNSDYLPSHMLIDYPEAYYKVGDRVGQLIVIPYPHIEFEEVDKLSDTERGTGGFGSTNINN